MDPQLEQITLPHHNQASVPSLEHVEATAEGSREYKEDEKLTLENNLEQKGRKLDENNDVGAVPSDQHKPELQEEPAEISIQNKEPSSEKTNTDSSSDEDMAIMNKTEALELFNKMTKESIQKLMQSDSSEEGNNSEGTNNEKDIDEMINSTPQDLIMMNGHAHPQHKSNVQAEHSKELTENHAKNEKDQTEVYEESKSAEEDEFLKIEHNLEEEGWAEVTEIKQEEEECNPNEDGLQEQEIEDEMEQPQELNEGEDEEEERQLSDREIRDKLKWLMLSKGSANSSSQSSEEAKRNEYKDQIK
jgi:hypothetical protein